MPSTRTYPMHTCCPRICDCCPDCPGCKRGVPARIVDGQHTPYDPDPTPEELAALGINPTIKPIHIGGSYPEDK